jgi:hypothetical protein
VVSAPPEAEAVKVVTMTWGTVTAVLMTVVVLDPAMVLPAEIPVLSVQGTTKVVKTWTVVTGTVVIVA